MDCLQRNTGTTADHWPSLLLPLQGRPVLRYPHLGFLHVSTIMLNSALNGACAVVGPHLPCQGVYTLYHA